jgi:hypothetical protein
MKFQRIPKITNWWLAVIMVLALLAGAGIAEAADQSLMAALGPDDLGAVTCPLTQPESTPSKQTIPPYDEKERIAIPDTFGAGQDCYATAYEAAVDDLHDFPALLCFACNKGKKARTCFEARSEPWSHQYVDRLKIVPICRDRGPREGVLFAAAVNYGGSGWTRLLTLWVYRKQCGQFFNILPEILIERSKEFKFLGDHEGKYGGVLVVAEQAPTEESKLQVDLVPQRITIYQYSHAKTKFKPISEFVTEKKYLYVTDVEGGTAVIDEHLEKIKRILDQK